MNTMFIPYGFLCIVFVIQTLFNTMFWRSFDENNSRLSLTYAVNSASDMATEYLLTFSQTTSYGNIYIDPNVVWNTYKYTMLRSLGMYSENNMKNVEYFFPGVIIAVNDGYFMRLLTQVPTTHFSPSGAVRDNNANEDLMMQDRPDSNGVTTVRAGVEWEYRFTQKLPFARYPYKATQTQGYVAEESVTQYNPIIPASSYYPPSESRAGSNNMSNPVIVADTMEGRNIMVFYPKRAGNQYVKYQMEGDQLPSVIGSAHSIPEIGWEILSALDYAMDWNAPRNSVYKTGGTVQIPIEISQSLTNDSVTLIGPQVLVICDQFNWVGNQAMSFYTMSNTQIVEHIQYFCYMRDGKNYYSNKKPDASITVQQIYSTMEQCAINGFSPDPVYYD